MSVNRASVGEKYRHKYTGSVAEVLEVTGATVFLRWDSGVKFSMSTSQFIRMFTYHIPWRLQEIGSFQRDEYEGIYIGRVYTHKNDGRTARVKDFYEKGGVVFVTYTWHDDHKNGARPVQSFKDTFQGFPWHDYEHYLRPGWRFVNKQTRECVTILHVLDDGEKVKVEYIKRPGKHTMHVVEFWEQFRPYAGINAEPDTHFWMAVIFDVNSARIWDTKYTADSLDDLTMVLDHEIPGWLAKETPLRVTVLSFPSGDVIYNDYIETWQDNQGRPDREEIFEFVQMLTMNCKSDELIAKVSKAVLSWTPINLYGPGATLVKAWREFREKMREDHWIDKLVSTERPKAKK